MKNARAYVKELSEKVNKTFGDNTAISLNDIKKVDVTDGLSTGSIYLNKALSGNIKVGFVRGRIVEILGPETSGKTTLAQHCIHEAQKMGWPTAYIDAEHALDVYYAEEIGIDFSTVLFSQPDSGEQALDVVETLLKEGVPLVVVDSVAALTPKAEIEGNMGDVHMGLQARLMSQACRKLTSIVSKNKSILIFINQLRHKIGVLFGNNETTPGGNALKFYASYRLDVRAPRGGAKEEKDAIIGKTEIGIQSNIKIIKNKLYPPYKKSSILIRYGKGFDRVLELLTYLDEMNLYAGKGTGKFKVGKEEYTKTALKKMLEENPKMVDTIIKGL